MSEPVLNPQIPYVAPVEGGLHPGKMLKVSGRTQPHSVLFAINYQLGPNLNPRDDIALHVSPRFPNGFITRNHIENMTWGPEENAGPMWIKPGQEFEILILCEAHCYKIAVNGRHFAEFRHRLPYQKVTHLVIDGDVEVESIINEIVPVDVPNPMADVPEAPNPNFGPPPPGGLYPTIQPPSGPMPPPPGPMPPGPYGPPPPSGGYNNPQRYGYQPGYEKPEEEDAFSGCLDKVGLALGGLVAAGGIAAAAHAMSKKRDEDSEKDHEKSDASKSKTESEGGLGSLGSIGTALASSLVSNVLSNSHAQQGYPPPPTSSPGGDVLGSILGALGGGGGAPPPQQQSSDPLSGALGSFLGGVLGGGGPPQTSYQPSGGYGQYQPSGGYQSGGGGGSDLLSSIGSSLFSSAMEGLSKHGKDKPRPSRNSPPPPEKPATPPPDNSSTGPGHKMTADEISKGLGLDD